MLQSKPILTGLIHLYATADGIGTAW